METADHYATLEVSSTAPASEIKSAYHRAAKEAHPDAGGSTARMQRVNEAYQVLSDPLARRDYDARRGSATAHHPHHSAGGHSTHGHPSPSPHVPTEPDGYSAAYHARHSTGAAGHTAASGTQHADPNRHFNAYPGDVAIKRVYSQIRFQAAERLKTWVPLAVVSYLLLPYLAPLDLSGRIKLLLYLISFVPVYGMVLSFVFLVSPEIRLNIYRSAHPKATRASREDFLMTGGIAASFVLFAGAWLLVMHR